MRKMMRFKCRRALAFLLAFAMVFTGVMPFGGVMKVKAAGTVSFTETAGYEEGAYAEWTPVDGADGYKAYVSADNSTYTAVDNELIRQYADYWRVDVLGLKAGTYYIKVEAVTVDADTKAATPIAEAVTPAITVVSHDRSGFAFVNGTSSGAYNEDGTLKSNARVVYITEQTKDTVSEDLLVGKNITACVGLQEILYGYKKGTEPTSLCVRIIGNISDLAVMDKGDIVIDGITQGITFEGVGEDAVANGWGLRVKGSTNVEVRNLGFMNCNSDEGDDVGLQQDNDHVWVHHCDFFYGDAGSDKDQVKGDGALDTKKSTYVTHSYNHFWDNGKCNLQGNTGEVTTNYITYHHNWFDHSDSRHPRIRVATIHVYNNYYDGNAKYGVGVTTGSSTFVEGNYFRNCKYPMLSSEQGTDKLDISVEPGRSGKGIFGSEAGGMIKAYNNYIEGAKAIRYANADSDTNAADATHFDAYLASTRDEQVPAAYKTVSGGTAYSNFDTNTSIMYQYTADTPEAAKEKVIANAGRVNGGDFKWTFDNSVEDTNDVVIAELKSALTNYETTLVSVGGIDGVSSGGNTGGSTGGSSEETTTSPNPTSSPVVPTGAMVHNFTTDGFNGASTGFTIKGNEKSNAAGRTYEGLTLTKALKIESEDKTSITFTASAAGTLTLVFEKGFTGSCKVDGTSYNATDGVATIQVKSGSHTILKGSAATNLYYISFVPEGAEVPTDPQPTNPQPTDPQPTDPQPTDPQPTDPQPTDPQPTDPQPTEPEDTDLKDFELNVGTDVPAKTYTENYTKNGFTVLADSTNTVIVESNTVTVNNVKYTQRMKTGGAGNTTYRSIMFTTEDAAVITIICVSSNGSQTRVLGLSDGTTDETGALVDLSTVNIGTSASTYKMKVSEAGTYYLHSTTGGINFYDIKVSYDTGGASSGRVDDEVREQAPDFKAGDLYVSTKGKDTAAGTFEDPMDLVTALNKITAGNTIWMFSGTYYAYDMYQEPIIIAEDNCGTANAMKKVSSINGKTVTIDFDGMAEEGSNRGITLDGSYWHFYDIDICNAGDNGMLLSGDYNIIELCKFYKNHDTGLQLSRFDTSYATVDLWPSYNLILNCTAYDNKDEKTSENADGFAAKLTCGEGNVFDGCMSYCNSDDGWDLFAKTETGPIGVVTIRNCVAFGNGKLTNGEGSAQGDMNGFKLGGSGVGTPHIVENCLAFNNGATGFTDNNNPSNISVTNCTAVNNGMFDSTKANFMTYRSASGATYTNLLSSVSANGASTDQFNGTVKNSLYHYKDSKINSGYYWVNDYTFNGDKTKYTGSEGSDYVVTNNDFINVTIPGYNASTAAYTADYHVIFRNPDGSINVDGLFEVKKDSKLYKAGLNGTYIGAKFSVDDAPTTYTVSVTNGSADLVKAEAGATVTITAKETAGKVFSKWVVKTGSVTLADANSATTTFVMPASLVEIEAQFVDVPTYTVSVMNGSATPSKPVAGATVTITAKKITGKKFSKWVVKSGSVTLADANSATTTFVMPAEAVSIEAQYVDDPSGNPDGTYEGIVMTELQKFEYDERTHYLSGQIVVVEWRDLDGDGVMESTVPEYLPKMSFALATDSTQCIDVFVTPTGTNTFYFDRLIGEDLPDGAEYAFYVTSGDELNVGPYRTNAVYTGNSSLGAQGRLGKIISKNICYKTAENGVLTLYCEASGYYGQVNSNLEHIQYTKSNYGDFISGQVLITEWIDGVSTVPKTTPKMSFESVDGEDVMEVFMMSINGTNMYYFDRNLSEEVNVTKEYVFRISLTEEDNLSPYRTMIATTNYMAAKEGVLWETDTQTICYKTTPAGGDNQLRVYAVNK